MAQPVLMDFTAVRNASKRYGELANDCKDVYDALQRIGQELQQAAAMGAVGAEAARIVVEVLRMLINMRKRKFHDIKGYLLESYVARREGDESAVPEFNSGIDL
jgi:hypothetical protein